MRRLEFVADSGIHVGITLPGFLAECRRASNHRSTFLSLASRYNRSVPVKASIREPCRHLWRWWRAATKCERGQVVSNRVHGSMPSSPLGWAGGVRPVALVPCRSGAASPQPALPQ
jgi:hypothetical protein